MAPVKKGRYEIKGKLGEGGMGVVFRAYDPPPMDRDVALKTLPAFPDPLALELFYKECRVLKSISHPNVVEIFDMGECEDGGQKKPFFVMPLLPGQTLDDLIKNASHRLTVSRVVEILSQTCRGLQAAHEHGLIHRDLKPSNIFVMADDSVKIIDFGVAHAVDLRSRSAGYAKGTLLYMAPEQVQHKPVSPQSDIFSLGVVCYEALTRRQPFRGTTEEEVINAILACIPPPASDINPAVGQTISRVVHKAMAKQPWNRYDSVREFGETLQKALRNEPIELFDPARIQPRLQRAAKALESEDYQFAGEIVGELEAEGNIDPQLTLLRTQIDQVTRQKTIAQLLESARARYEEEEDPLALQKIQEVLRLDASNAAALGLKSKIDERRSERQIEQWVRLARQHIDNHSYNPARDALQNVLSLRRNDTRATKLLKEIEAEEYEYLRLRREKADLYQAALNAWKNGEVSHALSQMKVVLDLDRRAPDTCSPETGATYQVFYNKVRSEHDAINNAYAEARRQLAEHNFAKALQICDDSLGKYPGHALFQALKLDVEEQQRQQLSAFIADVDRRLDAEPDLDAKVNLLREAVALYPDEMHFRRPLQLMEDKRDLVNSIVARAHVHETRGEFSVALSDLEILQTIYSPYPGLKFERERLQKRLEQQARQSAKASWVTQVDRQLEAGDYTRALELLDSANGEFPDDPELIELRTLAGRGLERANRADQLLVEGQDLCAKGEFDRGLEMLTSALQLDDRAMIRTTLCELLVQKAQESLERDWRTAESLVDRALDLEPSHALARSIRAYAFDRKREEFVAQCASQARRLQTAGDLAAAISEVEQGLVAHPAESRLTSLLDTLKKDFTTRSRHRLAESEQPQALPEGVGYGLTVLRSRPIVATTETADVQQTTLPAAEAFPATVVVRPPTVRPVVRWSWLVWCAAAVTIAIAALVAREFTRSSVPEAAATAAAETPAAVPDVATLEPIPSRRAFETILFPDSVSSVLVLTNQDDASVILDGRAYRAHTRGGQVRIPNLPATQHTVRVVKDGFTPSEIQTVTLVGGREAVLKFNLVPVDRRAALVLERVTAGAQVSLDDTVIGTVGSDGTLSYRDIQPGTHTLLFTLPGYEPKRIAKDFAAAQTLAVSDVELEPAAALHSRTLDLRPVVTGLELFDAPGRWVKDETWFMRKGGGFVLYNNTTPVGKFVFSVRLSRGWNPFSNAKRLKWVIGYTDSRNYVLLQVDDKYYYRNEVIDGKSQQVLRVAHNIPDNTEVFHLSIEASMSQLVHQFSVDGKSWRAIDQWAWPTQRSLAGGKFGFYLPGDDEVRISNFLFYPSAAIRGSPQPGSAAETRRR